MAPLQYDLSNHTEIHIILNFKISGGIPGPPPLYETLTIMIWTKTNLIKGLSLVHILNYAIVVKKKRKLKIILPTPKTTLALTYVVENYVEK